MAKKKDNETSVEVLATVPVMPAPPEQYQSLDALIKEGLTVCISLTPNPQVKGGTHYKFVASSPRGLVNEEVSNFDLALGFHELLTKVRERLKKLNG